MEIKKLLEKIKDSNQKTMIENIYNSNIVKHVICNNCKREVARIFSDNRIEPVLDSMGKMYLLATRPRLDGEIGFQCLCGNDSRLCNAEKGNLGIENNCVTKSDLEIISLKLEKEKMIYKKINGKINIDNFIIEDL